MASPSSLPRPLSSPSSSSIPSTKPQPSSIVITAPPWAKDEPPSPKASITESHLATESRPSDVVSLQSTFASHPGSPSRWWAFTLPRPREYLSNPDSRTDRRIKDRSMSWLPSAALRGEGTTFSRKQEKSPASGGHEDWNLSIPIPPHAQQTFTVSHTETPGWDTPWTSRPTAQGPSFHRGRNSSYEMGGLSEEVETNSHKSKTYTVWQKRRKKLRTFILNSAYVPLLFRCTNISFTTAALGMAIRIRILERRFHVMGAVGSSPTLVIIFAPLTLVHVMFAIYLEYLGRPLGLWRTSAKLAHTLSEVLFICAWSAALSLSFDNFFTSMIPCVSWSRISWYNELPRPPSNIPSFEGSTGDQICDDQLSLIILVGTGLIMYCINLVISLFRIFEKVKYHPVPSTSRS